jgi:hypothetical protein
MNFVLSTSTDNYKRYDLGGKAHVIIVNDSALNEIDVSLDGANRCAVIRANEGFEFLDLNASSIFVKSTLAGNAATFRINSFGFPELIYTKSTDLVNKNIFVPSRFKEVKRNGVD